MVKIRSFDLVLEESDLRNEIRFNPPCIGRRLTWPR